MTASLGRIDPLALGPILLEKNVHSPPVSASRVVSCEESSPRFSFEQKLSRGAHALAVCFQMAGCAAPDAAASHRSIGFCQKN